MMAELTIQVPDELLGRLEPLQERLPELLNWLVETMPTSTSSEQSLLAIAETMDAPPVYGEVLDFLTNRPSPQEIVSFKVSPEAQGRLRALLEKNRSSSLSEAEAAELEFSEQVDRLTILLKARAYALIG